MYVGYPLPCLSFHGGTTTLGSRQLLYSVVPNQFLYMQLVSQLGDSQYPEYNYNVELSVLVGRKGKRCGLYPYMIVTYFARKTFVGALKVDTLKSLADHHAKVLNAKENV